MLACTSYMYTSPGGRVRRVDLWLPVRPTVRHARLSDILQLETEMFLDDLSDCRPDTFSI